MPLGSDQVRWVAQLARLGIDPADESILAQQLTTILDYIDRLSQVDTIGVEPLAHPHDVINVFRPDEPTQSLGTDEALVNAPDRRGDFFSVPAVFDSSGP